MQNRTPGTLLERLFSLRVRPLAVVCSLFVIIAVGMMMINSVKDTTAVMQERVTDLRIARDQMFKEYRKLESEVSIVSTDDYIIAKARELYDMVMPGELLFVVKNPEALYGQDEVVELYMAEVTE